MRRFNKFIPLLLLIAALGIWLSPASLAQEVPAEPGVSARSVYLINADTGEVLYSREPELSLPMASTTKMMTALLVIENSKDLSGVVTASQRAAEVGESSAWIVAGEILTVNDLLHALLIQSGNDAAVALAEYQAGSVEAFVERMNRRAAELGMDNTHFSNPHGLDDPLHYSSASDLAILGIEVMKHPELAQIVAMQEATIPWTGQPYGRTLINHNHLLGLSPSVNGIKTGYTDTAGQCIVVSASDKGVNLVLAYLGGPSLSQRNQEVLALLQYGFDSYQQKAVIAMGQEYAAVDVPFQRGSTMPLVSEEDVVKQVYVKDTIEYKTVLPEELVLPVNKGDKVGLVEAYEGDTYLGSSYLLATEDVPKPGLGGRISYFFETVYDFLLFTARTA